MKKIAVCLILLLFGIKLTAQQSLPVTSRFKSLPLHAKSTVYAAIKNACAIGKKDTAAAVKLFRQIIKEAKLSEDKYSAGLAYFEMAEMHSAKGHHNKAFGGYFNARTFFEEAGTEIELAHTYYGLGREQYHRGSFNPAANHLNYAILFANRNNLKQLEADAQEFLAVLYNEISYFDATGRPLLQSALQIRENLGDRRGIALLLPKMARSYYLEKKYDSALLYTQRSVELSQELNMQHLLGNEMLEKADILLRLNRNAEARQFINDIKNISPVFTERNLRIRYHTTLGNILLADNLIAEASLQYDTAIKLAKKADTPDGLAIVFGRMSEAYAEKKEFKKAYDYQKEYNNLYVKLFVKESVRLYESSEFLLSKKMSDDEVKYLQAQNQLKQLKLQHEMELRNALMSEKLLKDSILQKEKLLSGALERENISTSKQLLSQQQLSNHLKQESLQQKKKLQEERMLRIVLIAGVFGLLALGALTWFQYRRVKTKKEIIQKQSYELQTLMKEIHHRVKNNLQIISSLLDIQSLSLTDKQAVEAIKEGRNRVQSMAILHQHLYHEGNIRGIKMGDYIITLVQNLFASYNINSDKISLDTDIDNITLDVDTVIPLGLIINELVSNSLKYAFGIDQSGTVRIALKEKNDIIELLVQDTGKGFPVGLNIHNEQTFGLQLISAFAQKLKATLEFYNDNGAVACIQIKKFMLA